MESVNGTTTAAGEKRGLTTRSSVARSLSLRSLNRSARGASSGSRSSSRTISRPRRLARLRTLFARSLILLSKSGAIRTGSRITISALIALMVSNCTTISDFQTNTGDLAPGQMMVEIFSWEGRSGTLSLALVARSSYLEREETFSGAMFLSGLLMETVSGGSRSSRRLLHIVNVNQIGTQSRSSVYYYGN